MSAIHIHEITYHAQSDCIQYCATVRAPGRSITISARVELTKAAHSCSLHMLAHDHAAALLSQPSSGEHRLDVFRKRHGEPT